MQGNRRITKEFEDFQKSQAEADSKYGVSASLVGNDITHWKGIVRGPEGTSYDGGTFIVDIQIPPDYPYKPPKMKFDTMVWHPNVSSQTGAICLDILKDEWSPALTIRTALISLQALMCSPEPDDPQDAQVAAQYKNNPTQFHATAKQWTEQHALDEETVKRQKTSRLVDMGFEEAVARACLEEVGWDEQAAVNKLLCS